MLSPNRIRQLDIGLVSLPLLVQVLVGWIDSVLADVMADQLRFRVVILDIEHALLLLLDGEVFIVW